MILEKEIIKTFSYSKDEQEAFPYLARYMKRVSKKLSEIEKDKYKLIRFALAGLLLTYRAFNHLGNEITIDIGDSSSEYIHYKRLGAFKECLTLR